MSNKIIFIIPSNMEKKEDVIRVIKSVDISPNIFVYFINQSSNNCVLNDYYKVNLCRIKEIKTGHVIPLSKARNIALTEVYRDDHDENTLMMFVDDDAWLDTQTVKYLLSCENKGMLLKTVDPQNKKSFKDNSNKGGIVSGHHICSDIVSICMVIPLNVLAKSKKMFNENLGLGCKISQGEESLLVFNLCKEGFNIYYDNHIIYHPYKKTFNEKNFYSLSYFFSMASRKVSLLFMIPEIKLLIKYSCALVLSVSDRRYARLFIAVWRGCFDGLKDKENVFEG